MLRLQGMRIALDRLSQKSTKALEARRKERAQDPDGDGAGEHAVG